MEQRTASAAASSTPIPTRRRTSGPPTARRSTSCAPARRRSRRTRQRTGCTSAPSPIRTATPTRRASPRSPAAPPNQVYVGYYGFETEGNPFKDTEAQKELGNGDDVQLATGGKLAVTRLLFRCDAERGGGCWENRSPRRIIYSHLGIAAGHSWWGFNHGVTHVLGDDFGDHVHPEVWYAPTTGTEGEEKLGEFYGIAPDANGNLWMAGRYGVGLQPWNPEAARRRPAAWTNGSRATSSTPSRPIPAITRSATMIGPVRDAPATPRTTAAPPSPPTDSCGWRDWAAGW